MNEIPTDKQAYDRLASQVQLRTMRAARYSFSRREEWVRHYKIWRKIQDAAQDPDEPNIALGYAFGIVEQIVSKSVEPFFRMNPPARVVPMKLGDMAKAENFSQVARNFYAKPNRQANLAKSKKEMVITGNRVEIDEYLNIVRRGKIWGKVPKEVEVDVVSPDGQPTGLKAKTTVSVDAEVPRDISIHKGFNTRYPSIFNVFFEPNKSTIGTGEPTDASWAVEDMGEMALEDMIREMYIDPHDGVSKPIYELDQLIASYGQRAVERYKKLREGAAEIDDAYGPLIIPTSKWHSDTDFGRVDKDTMYPTEGRVDQQSSEDRDKVWVVRMYAPNEIRTIANGQFIIQRVLNPWHIPIMPIRVENYTIDPEFLYGYGALWPIESEINEMNDIHNLSMSNWIRIINKMLAINKNAIVSMEDFKPRAGGKIRVRSDVDPRTAIFPIDQQDPGPSMINMESNLKGLMEFETSVMDGSSGTMGTKQSHKTYKGLVELENNLSVRFMTIQRQGLTCAALQMGSMERFFSQFQFEKQPFRIYRDDGSTALAEFNKDDIYTEGRGFEYLIEVDPNYGDSAVERQQDLFLLDRAVEYEKLRKELADPTMRQVSLDKLFEKVLKDFGYRDASSIFSAPGNVMTPENELQIIMQGGKVQSSDMEDRINHLKTHLMQRASPGLKEAVAAGKADPQTMKRLDLHIQETMAGIKAFMRDPQMAAEAQMGRAMEVNYAK